jgi:glycyl-tRNA synthetase beta chain
MPDLLLELMSEEIPARMQARAASDLKRLVTDGLVERGLTYADAQALVTPRRLALAVQGLADASPTTREERRGPRVDAPEKALEGFLRSTGLAREALQVRDDRKGQVWVAEIVRAGRPAAEIVAETVQTAVADFPWPKSMRWGESELRWVRPLHSVLCLLSSEAGSETVDLVIDGIRAGDTTRGHRFMAPRAIRATSFDDYRARLEAAFVLLDPEDRAARIAHDARQLAFAQGLEVVEDPGLLAEVAGLVEWPVVLVGRIEPRFLDLPPEVLRTSMKEHQKFLSLREPGTGRIVGYVVVANRETADGGATVLAGNARVLAARLSDAAFFWANDLRTPLGDMAAKLDRVTFHRQLGSQGERVRRIAALAREIAPQLGAEPDLAERAALLAKADLSSEMVFEFPELQGTMGRYYAERAGEDPAVAAACAEHYSPLGPSDEVPSAPVSVAVALADKIDLLTAFWAIDEKPTGSKDPFALRRAALGVIRLVLENGLRLPLGALVRAGYPGADAGDLTGFFADRLKVHLREQGVRHDVIDACFQLGGQDDLVELVARVRALQDFLGSEDGVNLLAGYRRAVNILSQEERKDGVEYSLDPIERLAETDAERALFAALDRTEAALEPALAAEDFAGAMRALAGLRAPIDAFFDTTTVNAESATVRRNRLCQLNRIRVVMNRVAAFSAVEGG